MALPVRRKDLQNLKSFIDFVCANPTILNYPQLKFVKLFIEKFGGKVPPGEFKMPDGGCPFGGGNGGGGQIEIKQAELDLEPDSEEAEIDSESESDVELDMDVSLAAEKYQNDSNPTNVIYLQESLETKQIKKPKKIEKKRNTDVKIKNLELSNDEAFYMDEYDCLDESDPIDTAAEVIIKAESDLEDHKDPFQDVNHNEQSSVGEIDSSNSDDETTLQHLAVKIKRKTRQSKKKKYKFDKEFWENSNKKSTHNGPKPINCRVNCKHKCEEHISEAERITHYKEYYSLNFVQRKNYILDLVETKKVGRIRKRKTDRIAKGYTNRYYMKTIGKKVRVCLNFFLSTLSICSGVVKNAMENRDCKGRYVGYDKRGKKPEHENMDENIPEDENMEQSTEVTECHISVEHVVDLDLMNVKHKALTELSQQEKPSLNETKPLQKIDNSHTTTIKYGWNKGRKIKKDRVPQPVKCDEHCQMKCTKYFTEEQRSQICQSFWSMDFKRRKDFILSRIETREVESMTVKEFRKSDHAQRTFSNRYFFKGPRTENIRVCSRFFMATLCIGRTVISNALLKADKQTGVYAGEDGRGNNNNNKISDEMIGEIKRHIESYPTWVPHKNHKTRFLHSSLSIQKLWRDYKQICLDQQRRYAGKPYFSKIFHKDYKLAFLKPNSKHANKASANKKNDVTTGTILKKTNTNISKFTGEEGGGYWIKPNNPTQIGKQNPNDSRVATHMHEEQNLSDNKRNILHIQENVQLHAPQPTAANPSVIVNPYFSAMNYVQPQQQQELMEQLHGDHNVPMQNYSIPSYESQHAVLRML